MRFKNVWMIADNGEAIEEYFGSIKGLGQTTTGVVFGGEAEARQASEWGLDTIYAYTCSENLMVEDYAQVLSELIAKKGGDLVLCTTTPTGRLLAGKLAGYLGTAVTAGIASIDTDGVTQKMVYGGAAHRRERLIAPVSVVTLGASTLEPADKPQDTQSEIILLEAQPVTGIRRLAQREKTEVVVNLTKGKRIVDVGRGLADEKDLDLIYDLAKAIGAEVGCSRPVAESNGWMPVGQYIGITGAVTAPDLIVVLGVSGQVQHIVGIDQAKTVVAINKDPNALIFEHADFGLVADMYKVLPKLIEALQK